MKRTPFPVFLLALIIFIAALNGFANEFSWYWRFSWLDMPMHFLGGFWVGGVALWATVFFRGTSVKDMREKPWLAYAISLASVLIVSALWESFEFGLDTLVSFSIQNSVSDTISDITLGALGGVGASLYFISGRYRKPKSI
ncbi:MAG: hypothetical protein BMS9Abin13_148 [Patescibacteria group bacterium]|nr:MAG: hypothetical protein BMS9Abin13_148 [Patescibacteria group bacterium]